MTPGSGFGGDLPPNVGRVSIATTSITGFYQDNVFPPLPVNNVDGSRSNIFEQPFNTTHGEIGSSYDALGWMLDEANLANVPTTANRPSPSSPPSPQTEPSLAGDAAGYFGF
jgi:hypothetical protein